MNYKFFSTLIVICGALASVYSRSPHRPIDPQDPWLTASWRGQKEQQVLHDTHLRALIFNIFDKEQFLNHLLPDSAITYRSDQKKNVSGKQLKKLIENLLREIQQNKKKFRDFTILKKRDFTKKDNTGLLILKFNDYPFILKLFIETPTSFVNPVQKGFEPTCFFYMGGGITRHLTGLTRIKNLEEIKSIISENATWKDCVDFPRKWFWLPEQEQWITLCGHNIGPNQTIMTEIPAIYGVIADEITWSHPFSMRKENDKKVAMSLSNSVDQRIDPHINNFGIEKGSGKIVPIDFEHFPTVVGLDENDRSCNGYIEWYLSLCNKMAYDTYGKNKQQRRLEQYKPYHSSLS